MEHKKNSLGDRYAEITVIVLTLIALSAGWLFKSGIENASVPFSVDGVSAQVPQGWRQSQPSGNELLRATDRSSSGFNTTYVLRNMPIASDVTSAQVANILALKYGQDLATFRILEQREVTVFGKPAYELQYVFVESNPNLTSKNLPSVVLGTDYVFLNEGYAVVASYWADENNHDLDMDRFLLFLESIKY